MKTAFQITTAAFCLLACSMVLVPFVTAVSQECALDPRFPDARFTCMFAEPATPRGGLPDGPPFVVNCYDQSVSAQEIATWHWEFGDGGTSTRQSPGHSYTEPGIYEVRLTVTTVCGSRYADTAVGGMDVYCILPEPQFVVDMDEGVVPLTVHVRDTSSFTPESVTRWTYWLDNTHKSTDRNPVFTYTRPGIYTINQTVTKDCVRPGTRTYPPYEHRINVTAPVVTLLFPMNISTITTPTTRASAVWFQPPYAINTTNRTASPAVTATTVTAGTTTGTLQGGQAAAGTYPPGTGTLLVNTTPSGARVYIDDILRGASPVTIPNLPAGSHTLRLEREGYRTMAVPVDMSDGRTTEYSTALVPESGSPGTPLGAATVVIALAGACGYSHVKKKRTP